MTSRWTQIGELLPRAEAEWQRLADIAQGLGPELRQPGGIAASKVT
jgi:hypothetical protein